VFSNYTILVKGFALLHFVTPLHVTKDKLESFNWIANDLKEVNMFRVMKMLVTNIDTIFCMYEIKGEKEIHYMISREKEKGGTEV